MTAPGRRHGLLRRESGHTCPHIMALGGVGHVQMSKVCSYIYEAPYGLIELVEPDFAEFGVTLRHVDVSQPGRLSAEIEFIQQNPDDVVCVLSHGDTAFRDRFGPERAALHQMVPVPVAIYLCDSPAFTRHLLDLATYDHLIVIGLESRLAFWRRFVDPRAHMLINTQGEERRLDGFDPEAALKTKTNHIYFGVNFSLHGRKLADYRSLVQGLPTFERQAVEAVIEQCERGPDLAPLQEEMEAVWPEALGDLASM